jgi:single-stranded DNA-binding protein
MNLIIASANYVGETFTDSGLRFMQLNIPATGKNNAPVPLLVIPNKAGGDSFDVFSPGCQILISGRIYPNRNDYKMYVVPTQPLQVVPKDLNLNQVNLAGGVGFIQEKKLEDLFAFSLMCKAPSQQLLGHNGKDSLGFRVESWGDDAKRLEALLYVGRQMALTGALRYNTWTAQDGSQRGTYQVRVRASQYSVFGKNQPKVGENQVGAPVAKAATPAQNLPMQQNLAPCSIEEDSVPF